MDNSRFESTGYIHFENKDIIITDPCYIMRAEHHGTKPLTEDDWHTSNHGFNMEKLGIKNYLTHSTIYGDWSCTTYNSDTGEVIGEFCADAGLVSVFDLYEVLKYNPDFDYHINRKWTTTLIKNFTGDVRIKVERNENQSDWDGDNYDVYVEGEGNINFTTRQTGY